MEEFNGRNKRVKRGLAITPLKFAPSFFAGPLFQVKLMGCLLGVYTMAKIALS